MEVKSILKTVQGGLFALLFSGALVLGAPGAALAAYPDNPVEMTVLFGGSADLTARVLAEGMAKQLKSSVPVVKRTGGGGAVGYTYVKGQRADGYSIVWNSNSISTAYHKGNMAFNYTAFEPVARVSLEVPALAVRSDSPWKSVDDLMKYARANPGKLKVGISGKGSFTHLTSAITFAAGKARVRYVPYGRGRATLELLGGRIDAALQWPSVFKSHADAGKLRILMVTSAERIPLLPNTPTGREMGLNLDVVMWRGIAAPKGTPPGAIRKLEQAIKATVESAEFIAASRKIGFKPAFLSARDFGKLIAEDDVRIAKVMTKLGLKK